MSPKFNHSQFLALYISIFKTIVAADSCIFKPNSIFFFKKKITENLQKKLQSFLD